MPSSVSRRHARLVVTADGAVLEDLGSKNGTFARGVRLTGPAPLADGDLVGFGSLTLTFHDRPPLMTTETHAGRAMTSATTLAPGAWVTRGQ